MTTTRIEEIRAREQAATKGPWGIYEGGKGGSLIDIAADLEETGCGYRARREICRLEDEPLDNDPAHREWTAEEDWSQVQADAQFTAHARDDVKFLLDRVAELEAQRERRRVRLVALQNDALNMRGSLSPMGEDRKVPFPLGETLTPAVDWLIARVAELEAENRDAVRVSEMLHRRLHDEMLAGSALYAALTMPTTPEQRQAALDRFTAVAQRIGQAVDGDSDREETRA